MKINDIKIMIEKDTAFLKEESHMDTSSLSIPELHAKYLQLIYDEKLALEYFKTEYKVLKRDKWLYYTGKSDPEVYVKTPFNLNILKADVDKFLDADTDLNTAHLKVKAQEEKLNLLTDIVKTIVGHSFSVGNAIKWKRFLNGEIG
jgi:hypothetical protein